MKKYIKEIIILLLQAVIFFLLPLLFSIRPIYAGTMVLILIIITAILSIIMGCISNKKIKYLYPVVVALLFLPSVMMYYNESAMIHSIWYLVISYIGIFMGVLLNNCISKK